MTEASAYIPLWMLPMASFGFMILPIHRVSKGLEKHPS